MPLIFRQDGYRFFFYSNEGDPREPVHVHVEKAGCEAKFWLSPAVSLAYNDGHSASALRTILRAVTATKLSSRGPGMPSSVSALHVRFDPDSFWVALSDGRTIGVPLAWFPRLFQATQSQREAVRISSRGLHWEELDEDISIDGLLHGDQTHRQSPKAA